MRQCLINDQGVILDRFPHSADPVLRIMTGAQFFEYAVKSLGYITFRHSDRSVIVRMRPCIVRPKAYVAMMYYLADRKPQRIALQHLEETWRHELFSHTEGAMMRITDLTKPLAIYEPKVSPS